MVAGLGALFQDAHGQPFLQQQHAQVQPHRSGTDNDDVKHAGPG